MSPSTHPTSKTSGASEGKSMIPGISQDKLNTVKDKFSGAFEGFSGNIDRASSFIKARPMVTFAAALGVGFLVGTLILRSKNRMSESYDAGSIQ